MSKIYIVIGVIFAIGSIFFIKQGVLEERQIETFGTIVTMEIVKIDGSCIGTKSKYSMKVKYQDKIFLKPIGGSYCEKHRVGDKVKMKYLEGRNTVLFPYESVTSQIVSSVLIGIFGLYVIYLGFKERRKEKA
jgi:hypothetical protein